MSFFGGSRKRGGKSRSRRHRLLLAAAGVAVAAVVALLWIVRGREAAAPPADFSAVLLELAATRGADPDRVAADEPIRKVGDVFVRSWQIAVPNRAAMAALGNDIVVAAAARGATVSAPSAAGDDTARVRVALGAEAFDVLVVVAAPVRIAELAPTAAPTPRTAPTATPRPRPAPGARGRLAILLDDAGPTMDSSAAAASRAPEAGVDAVRGADRFL